MSQSRSHTQAARWLLLAACLVAVMLTSAAQAAPGGLDPSFGAGGKVSSPIGNSEDYGYGLALQPDGKLVLAGSSYVSPSYDFSVARYNANGSLDTSFNGTGKVTTPIGAGVDTAFDVVRQPDGKLVLAGYSHNGSNFDFALARYNPNGSLDSSFGSGGKVMTPIGSGDDLAFALALQADGKLIVAGRSYNGSNYVLALARYNPNGSLDPSFGSGGKVTTPMGLEDASFAAVAVQPDGKVLAAGNSRVNGQLVAALVRYNPNGSLDSSFGSGGKVTTAFGDYADAHSLALQPDGKILAAGTGRTASQFGFSLARYNVNGSLDASFASGGKVTTPIGSSMDVAEDLALQPDGKVVAAGFSYAGSKRVFALVRYNPDGSLDPAFGSGGKATTTVGTDDQAYALVLQPDGKLVAGGFTYTGSNIDFALVRYLGNSLTVTKTGSGAGTVTSSGSEINCGATCSSPFAAVPVTLTATAAVGSSFIGWSGDCSGSATCALTMSSDHLATARFETDQKLRLKKAGRGRGKVSSRPAGISCRSKCAHDFTYGTVVRLTAVASKHSRFVGWSGACRGHKRCTVTMSAARSVTAKFKKRAPHAKARRK